MMSGTTRFVYLASLLLVAFVAKAHAYAPMEDETTECEELCIESEDDGGCFETEPFDPAHPDDAVKPAPRSGGMRTPPPATGSRTRYRPRYPRPSPGYHPPARRAYPQPYPRRETYPRARDSRYRDRYPSRPYRRPNPPYRSGYPYHRPSPDRGRRYCPPRSGGG